MKKGILKLFLFIFSKIVTVFIYVECNVSAEWLIAELDSFETFRDDTWDSDCSGMSESRGAAKK